MFAVVAANIPYKAGTRTNPPLFQLCKTLGFQDDFATDLVRLVINHLQRKRLETSSLVKLVRALQKFVEFLAAHSQVPSTLTDIDKDIWLEFLEAMEADQLKNAKETFNYSRQLFTAYGPTSHSGWLAGIPFRDRRRTKPSPEHTSELAEATDYSDVVMYQLLSLFIYQFDRRIKYLKRYERITEVDMPKDWLYPGRIPIRGKGALRDTVQLVRQWLQDEDTGYEVLIDHHLMHYKAGLIRRSESGALHGGIATTLHNLRASETALVSKFQVEMGRRHGYDTAKGGVGMLHFISKRNYRPKPTPS